MSRNNVILVASYNNRYYVFNRLNADTEWNTDYVHNRIKNEDLKYTKHRAKALVIAHDYQKKYDTEYGVHEIDAE